MKKGKAFFALTRSHFYAACFHLKSWATLFCFLRRHSASFVGEPGGCDEGRENRRARPRRVLRQQQRPATNRAVVGSRQQQVQDAHVSRPRAEGQMSSRQHLHLCTFTGRNGEVNIFRITEVNFWTLVPATDLGLTDADTQCVSHFLQMPMRMNFTNRYRARSKRLGKTGVGTPIKVVTSSALSPSEHQQLAAVAKATQEKMLALAVNNEVSHHRMREVMLHHPEQG